MVSPAPSEAEGEGEPDFVHTRLRHQLLRDRRQAQRQRGERDNHPSAGGGPVRITEQRSRKTFLRCSLLWAEPEEQVAPPPPGTGGMKRVGVGVATARTP